MKGITPVIAVVLLFGVTVAAAGTLWTIVDTQQENFTENAPTVEFNTNYLNVESCWSENGQVRVRVRNDNSNQAINITQLNAFYEYEMVEWNTTSPDIVEPLRTFDMHINNQTENEDPIIEISNSDGDTIEHRCFRL